MLKVLGCPLTFLLLIWDNLRPMREHGSILLYVHGNHKARQDGKPRTSISTFTQLLNYRQIYVHERSFDTHTNAAVFVVVFRERMNLRQCNNLILRTCDLN